MVTVSICNCPVAMSCSTLIGCSYPISAQKSAFLANVAGTSILITTANHNKGDITRSQWELEVKTSEPSGKRVWPNGTKFCMWMKG